MCSLRTDWTITPTWRYPHLDYLNASLQVVVEDILPHPVPRHVTFEYFINKWMFSESVSASKMKLTPQYSGCAYQCCQLSDFVTNFSDFSDPFSDFLSKKHLVTNLVTFFTLLSVFFYKHEFNITNSNTLKRCKKNIYIVHISRVNNLSVTDCMTSPNHVEGFFSVTKQNELKLGRLSHYTRLLIMWPHIYAE